MITNDDELQRTRETLALAEAAFEATRRDFANIDNPIQYYIFSASTIELLLSIRDDIDQYLGLVPDSFFIVSLEGRALVGVGRPIERKTTPVEAITSVVDRLQRGLRIAVRLAHPELADAKPADWIDGLCDLALLGLGPRGVHAYLEPLAFDDDRYSRSDWQVFLLDGVSLLIDALEWAAQEGAALPPSLVRLPPAAGLALLDVVAGLLPPETGPVERIVYTRHSENAQGPRIAALTRESSRRVLAEVERLGGQSPRAAPPHQPIPALSETTGAA